MLSPGGGNTQVASVTAWTKMATDSAPSVSHTGNAIEGMLPFRRSDPAHPARSRALGGAVPYSGGGGIQIGINFSSPWHQPGTYGLRIPTLGYGASASMTIDIIPAPEAGAITMLSIGSIALLGVRRIAARS